MTEKHKVVSEDKNHHGPFNEQYIVKEVIPAIRKAVDEKGRPPCLEVIIYKHGDPEVNLNGAAKIDDERLPYFLYILAPYDLPDGTTADQYLAWVSGFALGASFLFKEKWNPPVIT